MTIRALSLAMLPLTWRSPVRPICAGIYGALWGLACGFFLLASASRPAWAGEPTPIEVAGRSEIFQIAERASYIYEAPDPNETDIAQSTKPGEVVNLPLEKALALAATENEFTLREVEELLAKPTGGYIHGDYAAGPFWARIILTNSGGAEARWRFDYRYAYGDSIRVYTLDQDRRATLAFSNRWVTHPNSDRHPVTRLLASDIFVVPPHGRLELWVDAEWGWRLDESRRLVEETRYVRELQHDVSYESFVFGLRTALLLALLAFAFVLKNRTAYYYSVFHAGLIVLALISYGYARHYLGWDRPSIELLERVVAAVSFTAYALTMRSFLDAQRNYPTYDKVLLGSLAAGWVSIVVLNLVGVTRIGDVIAGVAVAQFMAVCTYGVYRGVQARIPGAWLFMMGSLLLFAWGMLRVGYYFDLVVMTIREQADLVHAFATLDGVIFAGALVVSALSVRRQRDQAQAERMVALSERADMAELLSQARRDHLEAVRLAERRRRQLAATSHDLKQPLLSLQMALKKFAGGERAAEGLSYIESVLQRSLDETRPKEAETAPARSAGLSLERTMRNVVTMFAGEAEAKGIRLSHASTGLLVEAEPIALMRILSNLVANAVNHSGGSRVLVGARRDGAKVKLIVADNGRGLSEKDAARVFEAYRSGAQSKGEGLGLAVVKELAEAQGWTIGVRASPGRGAMFVLSGVHVAGQ